MRKIHVTRQFFEASGRHGDLIEKTKNPFLDDSIRFLVPKNMGIESEIKLLGQLEGKLWRN